MGRGLAICILLLLSMVSAAAMTDGERLAVLAANMQPLAEEEYALDCGPVNSRDSVLNTQITGIEGSSYCVLRNGADGDEIIFGTFMDAGNAEEYAPLAEPILGSYAQFSPHIAAGDLPDDLELACPSDQENFSECQRIQSEYGTLYPYSYVDSQPDGKTIFVIVSDHRLTPFSEPTLWDRVTGFFRDLFGMRSAGETESALEYGEFHHAHFASIGDRKIAATWRDRKAVIVYTGFVTDFRTVDPDRQLGTGEKQRIELDLSKERPEDVNRWQKLTGGLRVADIDGNPPTEVCGNGGEPAFDEECEPGQPITVTCQSFGLAGPAVTCTSQCAFNTTQCICADADGDGFNNTGISNAAACGTVNDCNDNRSQVVINNISINKSDGTPLTGASIFPGATDWCGNGVDENCDGKIDNRDGGTCTPVPPPPLVCNFNGTCDTAESATCRDCAEVEEECPSTLELVEQSGYYNISVRANNTNQPELIIRTANTTCLFPNSIRTRIFDAVQGVSVIYRDGAGFEMLLITNNTHWNITGNASKRPTTSSVLKRCWGADTSNGADISIVIPINEVQSCVPLPGVCGGYTDRCEFDTDCCGLDAGEYSYDGECRQQTGGKRCIMPYRKWCTPEETLYFDCRFIDHEIYRDTY